LSSIEQKEEAKGSRNLNLLKTYKAKIESELNNLCGDILKLLDDNLIKQANTPESKVILVLFMFRSFSTR
jgi:14-3-3 protein epsilon